MNNENKQNPTNKIDSSLGRRVMDELLALKEEMAGRIEEIIARIEQNLDRRLEDAILFLAGACDDESAQEVMGFNESDSRFGHYLARWLQSGEKLTLKQAEAALQMMQKYSQCQLEPNGYSLPTAWEEISHQYRERTIEIDLVGHFFGCLEDSILFLARYDGDDDMGFNESDSRFGHYLAGWLQRGEQLTLKQAEAALGMMQKYRQSQLEPNDYSLPTAWEYISHNYLTIGGDPPALSAVLKTGQRFVLRTGEYCDTFISLHYPNPNLHEILGEYSEDIWDWEESMTHHVLLDAAPRLMDAVAYYREYGYATYVDPDIEAAYYLWEQERQRMISEREPVLPLYAVPPDALQLDTIPLESERGVDYQELRRLLQRQDWYKADRATDQLFCNFLCQRAEELRAEDGWTIDSWSSMDTMKQFPCKDLRTIDQLWVVASGGKFGFSVQRKIWLGLGLTNLDVEDADLDKFADAVGWGLRGRQIYYRKSPFDLSTAPNGHFPRWGYCYGLTWSYGQVIAATAFQKAEICNLYIPTGEQSE